MKIHSYYLLIIAFIIVTAFAPITFLINFANDDSFFYLKIAKNVIEGNGLTFDGYNATNGFHLLWFLLLTICFELSKLTHWLILSPENLFRLVAFVTLVICLLTFAVSLRILKTPKDNFNERKITSLIILLSLLVFTRDWGMETHLSCLIFAVYIWGKLKTEILGKYELYFEVLLLVLMFLLRVDFLFSFVIPLLLVNYSRRRSIIPVTIVTSVVVSYFALHYFFFNHLFSVSAAIKSSFPKVILWENAHRLIFDIRYLTNQTPKLFFVVSTIIFYFYLRSKKIVIATGTTRILILLNMCSLLFLLNNLSFNREGIREWYVTLPVFMATLILLDIIEHTRINLKFFNSGLLVVFVIYFISTRIINDKWETSYLYAKDLQNYTTPSDKIFQIDMCGVVGYFSNRSIVNGDGLVNSYEYIDILKQNRLAEYLQKQNIKYYSTYSGKTQKFNGDSLFVDMRYSRVFANYPFSFPVKNIIFQRRHSYNRLFETYSSVWSLVKISD